MPTEPMKQAPLRLAMRVEGRNWCAYAAKADTMLGALFLGSIAMSFVEHPHQRARKDAFLKMMTESLAEMLGVTLGARDIEWNDPVRAPEHERSRE